MAGAGCCQSPSPLQVTPKPVGINLTHLFLAKPHPRASLGESFWLCCSVSPQESSLHFKAVNSYCYLKALFTITSASLLSHFLHSQLHSSKPQTPSDKPRDCLYLPRTLPRQWDSQHLSSGAVTRHWMVIYLTSSPHVPWDYMLQGHGSKSSTVLEGTASTAAFWGHRQLKNSHQSS